MTFAFPPVAITTLPVVGTSDMFPVNRVYCVGRNYAAHALEMGHDPSREPPFFFQKHPSCLVTDGVFPYPDQAKSVEHEIELAVGLKAGGSHIPPDEALGLVFGYAVALDMTWRDVQAEAKKLGRPWDQAKSFDASAPCSAFQPAARIGHPAKGEIYLDVNGARRQSGDLSHMIWGVPDLIARLSVCFTLRAGDIILTGTPEGVGPVRPGDRLKGHVAGIGDLEVLVG